MVINLPRHLNQVEKIVRSSDEWKNIMAITDVPTPKKIDGTDFGIFVDHPQKGLLLESTEYRKAVQQRASSTVSKDMKSLMECLKALNRSGNLQLILKAPDDDRNRIRHIFRARVVNPMKNWVKKEGSKAASGCCQGASTAVTYCATICLRDYHFKSGFSTGCQGASTAVTYCATICLRDYHSKSGFSTGCQGASTAVTYCATICLRDYHSKSGFSTGCQYTPTTILDF
ncbi:hypothetical protein RRG08_042208 [Elysia crispata]|uniref:Uncharacterized protein n=1 Tax=Elysia crispata TaxID=231223 RepID=A0AAE1EEA7_9GAST|nr:hypothetical protein RRG08_042208 [Elysia crispata]